MILDIIKEVLNLQFGIFIGILTYELECQGMDFYHRGVHCSCLPVYSILLVWNQRILETVVDDGVFCFRFLAA